MGCFPCTTLQPEVSHLNACYPPSKALITSGPEYRPLSQDLSKLLYFATNKPSKLANIGEELEKRINKESIKSTGGYPKYRASLLISLAILRALLTECKRDISLFGKSALRSIKSSLNVKVYQKSDELDLEVIGRSAAAFIAFTTFTDGSLIGIDENTTRIYLEILDIFSKMATFTSTPTEKGDMEQQNRTRLIALAALNGAVTSDSIITSNAEFPKQINILLPPLLTNLFEGTMEDLKFQIAKIEMDASPSPYFNEFSAVKRPLNDRRAPSLHAHIPGEKGPSNSDVNSASLRSFHALISQCKVSQAIIIIDNIISFLDHKNLWNDVEKCCWLSERLTAWITLQFRFVIPTRLIEVLVDQKDIEATPKHTSILSMVITILNSTTSLVGLGVSDLLGNLINLITRRIKFDQRDPLLPALVQCISSLGIHIYYADQINDIIEEISIRIAEIPINDKDRSEIIRALINCLIGVMVITDQGDKEASTRTKFGASILNSGKSIDKGKSPEQTNATLLSSPTSEVPSDKPKSTRRNPISPEVWQETLPLLCESDYSVRISYSRALLLFLENEMPRGKNTGSEATIYRFCNALHASVYTLVMSNCLGAGVSEDHSNVPSPEINTGTGVTPSPHLPNDILHNDFQKNGNNSPKINGNGSKDRNGSITNKDKGVSFNLISPSPSSTPPTNGSSTPPKKPIRTARRPSLPLNRLHSYVNLNSFDNVATPLDFAAALKILDELYTITPTPALITGTPMLLALDEDAGNELVRRPNDGRSGSWVLERKRAIRELVCLVWRRIGERWSCADVQNLAERSYSSLPEPYLIPFLPPYEPTSNLALPEQAISFPPHIIEGESSSASKPLLDPEAILASLTNSPSVQNGTGRDGASLRSRWASKWSVENAVKDSIERFSSAHVQPVDSEIHNDIASVLMNMNNGSYHSFSNASGNRHASRSIDVDDLREALGGKVEDHSSSPPSIISSALTAEDQHHLSAAIQRSIATKGIRTNQDVKEVLKDIFKDKKRVTSGGSGVRPTAHRIRTSSGLGKEFDGNGAGAVAEEKGQDFKLNGKEEVVNGFGLGKVVG
ncbi:uncharacterized protein IL334_005263 [Kwoniella shivajii]|uniref:Protein EFR3 n=1 Tax=Kwoniella shivajii TaxID=564305 RepID=A0ABZ1D2N5_9TREE|nr:hypothetical protein IL334_005263 [Kwoniella shivajii]